MHEAHTILQQECRRTANLQLAIEQLESASAAKSANLLALAERFDAQKRERAKIESLTELLGRKF